MITEIKNWGIYMFTVTIIIVGLISLYFILLKESIDTFLSAFWKEWHRTIEPNANELRLKTIDYVKQGRYAEITKEILNFYHLEIFIPSLDSWDKICLLKRKSKNSYPISQEMKSVLLYCIYASAEIGEKYDLSMYLDSIESIKYKYALCGIPYDYDGIFSEEIKIASKTLFKDDMRWKNANTVYKMCEEELEKTGHVIGFVW